MEIQKLNTNDADFWNQLDDLLAWDSVSDQAVFDTVNGILRDVKTRGDEAVIEYTNKFDQMNASSMAELAYKKH